jgi:hypothetical protein
VRRGPSGWAPTGLAWAYGACLIIGNHDGRDFLPGACYN